MRRNLSQRIDSSTTQETPNMLTRRAFLQSSLVAGAALGLDRFSTDGAAGPELLAPPMPLTPFKDPLPIPPVWRPQETRNGPASLVLRLREASQRLHSELPPTPIWGYEGHSPGPTIEVQRGQRL